MSVTATPGAEGFDPNHRKGILRQPLRPVVVDGPAQAGAGDRQRTEPMGAEPTRHPCEGHTSADDHRGCECLTARKMLTEKQDERRHHKKSDSGG